jgi:hypothetical protein
MDSTPSTAMSQRELIRRLAARNDEMTAMLMEYQRAIQMVCPQFFAQINACRAKLETERRSRADGN